MSLATGTRLGAYEIVSPLGAGRMGSACGLRAGVPPSRLQRFGEPRAH